VDCQQLQGALPAMSFAVGRLPVQVGLLSKQARLVRIKNVLTEQEDVMEVPSEETLGQESCRCWSLEPTWPYLL
jgi:hypothetical protein